MSEPIPLLLIRALQEGTQEGAPAPAEQTPTGVFGGGFPLIPLLLIFAIFYIVMIGPERKQRKKREAMLAAMKKGDKVITTSGLHGVVAQVRDDVVVLQVADGVRLRFSRAAVQSIMVESEKADEEPKAAASGQKG